MADTNEFDRFDAPSPTGGAAANANPFDQFDGHAKKPAAPAADPEPNVAETAGRALVGGAVRVAGDLPYLAGGLVGAVGARDTSDKLFSVYEKSRTVADKIEGPSPTSIPGRIAQVAGSLPAGIVSLGANSLVEPEARIVKEGGSLAEGYGQLGLNTAANLAGVGIGGLGKTVAQRVAQQGLASGALGEASRIAGNATRGDEQQQAFDPVELGLNIGAGAGLGLLPHGKKPDAAPAPGLTPELAGQAADLQRGINARAGTPDNLALPPGQAADFVAGANGETMTPEQARARSAGGAGMEQQGPGGPPAPVIPEPPAPLALTHQPDITVDSSGRAVLNKGDKTARAPFGGPGLDEQAAPPPPPAGPLGRAAVAAGTEPTLRPPPEAAAPAVETGGGQPTAGGDAGAAAAPARQSLRDAYAERQSQIDALNERRKSGQLDETGLNQLHDLRDVQDSHDPLTGMLNEKGFNDAVKSGEYTHTAAMDLDQFKPLNDTFGHKAGDAVLQHVSQLLHDVSDSGVTVARLHGDEYAAIAKGDPSAAMAAAQKKLRETPFTVHYVDKDGNPHSHTFDGIGITFGVGHNYEAADAAANANKPKGGRRNSDSNTGSARPQDVQAAAGSDAHRPAGGGQEHLPGPAAGSETAGPVSNAAATDQSGNRAHAQVAGEAAGQAAARGSEGTGAAAEVGAVAHGLPAAQSERTNAATAKEQRVAQAQRDHFTNLADEIGWDQRGGQLLRAPEEPGQGGHAPVIGRTQWVGKAGPLGESGFWRHRPDSNLTEKQAHEAFRKAAAGEKLKPIEQRFIDHANKTAQHYAEQEDIAREEMAAKRGFDSVEAMHEHDAINPIGAEHYDGESREDIPFSRGGDSGMSRERLQAAIAKIVRGWQGDAPRVRVHQSHDEAPSFLRNARGFDRAVEGAYDPTTGTIHLFGDAIRTPQRAAQVLAHEAIGHYGFEGVLGKDKWGKFVADLNAMRAKAPRAMREVFAELDRRYPGADPETAASEAVAIMAEKGIRNSVMDRVIAAVRQFVRSLGIDAKFSDAELRQMLVAAQRRVQGERFQRGDVGQQQPAFSKRTGGADADMFGGGEKPSESTSRAPAPKTGDMFGGASARDHVDAAVRAKDEQLSGAGKATTMRQGDGELFAGKRPEQTHIEAAALDSAAHPENPRPEPTPAQHEAGNFKMGHADVNGLDVTIEIPKGGERRGTDVNGKEWSRPVSDHYGYIKRTVGADGEHVDVYLGPHAHEPDARVYVVDQVKKGTGKFDEHKAMIGYKTQAEAVAAYRANFPKDMDLVGGVKAMGMDDFKSWVKQGELKKPAAQARFSKADPGQQARIDHGVPDDLQERGEELRSAIDAERRWNNGDRIFGFHDLDEGEPVEVTRYADLKNWAPDQLLAYPSGGEAKFSKADPAEEKISVAYAGDRFVQRDRLAQRKFDKPYAKLSVDEKGDVDALFQTTSAERNPMFSKAQAAGATKQPDSFLDRVTGIFKPNAATKAANALKAVALQGRDLARGVSRAAWAARDRAVGTADAAIDAFRSHFDARPAAVRSDPLKSYESVIAYQQKKPIADPVARKFIDTMAGMLDAQATAIRKFGEDKLGLLDQYFPQLWKDPVRAEKLYADLQAKRPLAGSKGFTKERVFADYEQGIKAGMEPAYDNPADALMARYQSGERYLSALRIRAGIDRLGLLHDIGQGDRVPAGFARVNDNSFAGKVVPELIAKDLNNYLAPGLSQFAGWRNFRWMQNTLLSARLGFSAFHAGFTTVDSAMTHLDLGMRRALEGDLGAAVKHLAQIPLTPFKALQGLIGKGEGAKLVRQFYGKDAIDDPHTAAVLSALTEGGARGRMDPTDYNNDFAQTLRAFRTDGAAALAKTPLRTFGAVLEAAMRPIAHNLVPAQKMTARVDLMKYELDRVAAKLGKTKGDYAGITEAMNQDALRQIANTVVQRVDDRLGQLAYDNLFWNRTVKDILQASIQSVGWNVGTKNVIFGGLGDVRKIFNPEKLLAPLDKEGKITDAQMARVTGRLSYLVALNLGIGTLGAVTQYLLTGEGPQELRDYFFPKTGNKNPDGSDARMSFPSYVKDEFGFARHPIDTIQHKLHPSFSMVAELLNNKDFYGNEVFNPDDPWTKVAGQIAGHVVGGFEPYAFQNQANVAAAGGGLGSRLAPFVGVTPAPGDITHSDFQNYVSEKYYGSHPSGGKTPEQAEQGHQFMQAANALRRGEQPDLSAMTPKERASVLKYSKSDPIATHFGKLNLEQKLQAYDRATDAERTQYKLRQKILGSNVATELQKEPDVEARDRLRQRIEAIRAAK